MPARLARLQPAGRQWYFAVCMDCKWVGLDWKHKPNAKADVIKHNEKTHPKDIPHLVYFDTLGYTSTCGGAVVVDGNGYHCEHDRVPKECHCSTYGKRYCPLHHKELDPPS